MANRPQLPLDWLDPTLDQCRLAIRKGVERSWQKGGSSSSLATVTDLDLKIEDTLVGAIRARFPHAAVVSEERHQGVSALEAATCFVVDPIDGTQELLAGRPGFGISVALFKERKPEAAVLDFPALDHRFSCGSGTGVWLEGVPLVLRRSQTLETARIVVSATQRRAEELHAVWARLKVAEIRPTSAFTPKFVPLLLGECDAAIHLPVDDRETFVWDYTAAAMLLREAGGQFTSWAGADILHLLPPVFRDGWIASTSPDLQLSLRHVLQQALQEAAPGNGRN
jgi:myo-inositol-1(or 4)-monophosphatase